MNKTSIGWTDYSWNPIVALHRETGKRGWFCTHVSLGCDHCYSETLNRRFGNGLSYGAQNEKRVKFRLNVKVLSEPLQRKQPAKVFVCDMTDLFHPLASDDFIGEIWLKMAEAKWHTFQVLTKRPERMRVWLAENWTAYGVPCNPLPNVWLGVSVEDQKTADDRIPVLLQTPASVRFVSYEPALDTVDLIKYLDPGCKMFDRLYGSSLSWVICGGESGPKARACDLQWLLSCVDQCQSAGVACWVKQLGSLPVMAGNDENIPRVFKAPGSKGEDWEKWPNELRVREFPYVAA